jgi:hypothetical protein
VNWRGRRRRCAGRNSTPQQVPENDPPTTHFELRDIIVQHVGVPWIETAYTRIPEAAANGTVYNAGLASLSPSAAQFVLLSKCR